jgi:deoxyribodipyrimidine photolyase-related protein
MTETPKRLRNLVLVLGDQLDRGSAAFDGFDPAADAVLMIETASEAKHVWSHKARIAIFLSAMRHFRDALKKERIPVDYRRLEDEENTGDLASELEAAVRRLHPRRLVTVEPGEWRVMNLIETAARKLGVEIDIRPDRSFFCPREVFESHAKGRKQLRMEFFYREMRRRTGTLLDAGKPAGGKWNYDAENRGSFGKAGPGELPLPPAFAPDALTRRVIRLVNERFAGHPGATDSFDWPVTPEHAAAALEDFVSHRLPVFGAYQDAMWTGEPFLYHSLLSPALNLKLLDPRKAVAAAEKAWRKGRAPLASVEGFVRQILGWREFVRGVYWRFMPEYIERNALGAKLPLPGFYWTADTDMACLRAVIGQTLDHGYAHHIQRLMVTGLFALLLGVNPIEVHRWYLAVYVDAVEWVELPNTLGMSQYADGGVMASKPYAATGKYIRRMSNYCDGCRYDPAGRTGETACPFTTLYWDFLLRHEKALARNQRMRLQVRNLERLGTGERRSLQRRAENIRRLCYGH